MMGYQCVDQDEERCGPRVLNLKESHPSNIFHQNGPKWIEAEVCLCLKGVCASLSPVPSPLTLFALLP